VQRALHIVANPTSLIACALVAVALPLFSFARRGRFGN